MTTPPLSSPDAANSVSGVRAAFVATHRADLIRLSVMALAIALGWFEVGHLWRIHPSVDLIALVAILIGGTPIYGAAWHAIRTRHMTMELTMTLAIAATLLVGEWQTGVVVTFFVLLAEWIEHLTVTGGRRVIQLLVESLPRRATIRQEGAEREIDVAALRVGDLVILKPGSTAPADGVVRRGHSYLNQSSLTGESLPVEKRVGDTVLAGTINQSGALEVETQRVGGETTFGKIIRIIEHAEATKAPIQRVADTLASWLLYVALGVSGLTWFVTHDVLSAVSAFMVAGSCGVAAGTPLAILAGIGRCAKEGVIVKGGASLEQLRKVDTIVLDKTGTLTLGKPRVTAMEPIPGVSPQDLLRWAAIAEQHSEHHVAKAVLERAREDGVTVTPYTHVTHLPGQGVVCQADGQEILVGNGRLLAERRLTVPAAAVEGFEETQQAGGTAMWVARAGKVIGYLAIADVLRDEARQAVDTLKTMGCRVLLMTGDTSPAARVVGSLVGANESYGDLLPHEKLERVKALMAEGRQVAMVGDGVNDAPALIQATVGIAMGTGTDVAMESADIGLMTNNLMNIVEALTISRRSWRVIMFNFWATLVVDAVGMTLALLGHLTPISAAAIHVGSEMALILNSARLFRTRS